MKNPEKRILTIPNIISFIRIGCIPFFVYFFYQGNFITAGIILIASGITDLFDGKLARRLNQVTELGKMLDPVADKLTEAAIAILLFLFFRNSQDPLYNNFLCWIFLFFIAKEGLMLIIGLILLLCKIKPVAAEIYGKISTFSFYTIMAALLVFGPEIGAIPRMYPNLSWMVLPEWITVALVFTAALLALAAFFSYFPPVYRQIKKSESDDNSSEETVIEEPEIEEAVEEEIFEEETAETEEFEVSDEPVEEESATPSEPDYVDSLIDGILDEFNKN